MNDQRIARFVGVTTISCVLASACSSARRNTAADEQRPHVVEALAKARAHTLRVGDRAPALGLDQWIKGAPVEHLDEGRLYVVSFWATWCPPSVSSLAHLTAVQRDHAAVTFIAVASNEKCSNANVDDRAERLKDFVDARGHGVDLRVAFDADGGMREAWVDEAGDAVLPRAFIVGRDGRIAWIGHPLQLEPPLQALIVAAR